jgi:hypothetical protein
MQKGSGQIPLRWRRVSKQSCLTHNWNSATTFLLGQSGVWLFLVSMAFGFRENKKTCSDSQNDEGDGIGSYLKHDDICN